MLNKIIDPVTKNSYNINSNKAKQLLKNYITTLNGGENFKECRDETTGRVDKNCIIQKIKKMKNNGIMNNNHLRENKKNDMIRKNNEDISMNNNNNNNNLGINTNNINNSDDFDSDDSSQISEESKNALNNFNGGMGPYYKMIKKLNN